MAVTSYNAKDLLVGLAFLPLSSFPRDPQCLPSAFSRITYCTEPTCQPNLALRSVNQNILTEVESHKEEFSWDRQGEYHSPSNVVLRYMWTLVNIKYIL